MNLHMEQKIFIKTFRYYKTIGFFDDFNIILFETDWFNLYNVNKYIHNKSENKSAKEALSNIHSFSYLVMEK